LRVIVTGGAPLNGETQAFVETCFGASVHPGFGLTETCGIVSANAFESGRLKGSCGPPVSTCNVRLVSCPNLCDANGRPYLASDALDEKGAQCWGRGEVVVSGTNLASRYFKQPAITAEAFGVGPNKQREFSTGDIGKCISCYNMQ
jgi:long-chain acyl-CoA synthetase